MFLIIKNLHLENEVLRFEAFQTLCTYTEVLGHLVIIGNMYFNYKIKDKWNYSDFTLHDRRTYNSILRTDSVSG